MTRPARTTAGPTSLHQRILADVERRILSGQWPPGHRIPFEEELAALYGCSRMTVNKVMTQLAAAGLIERRRRAGSFVTRPRGQSAVLEIPDIQAEVASLGLPYRFAVTARERRRITRASGADFERLGAGLALHLACLHFAGEVPFCLEDRLISLIAVPEAEGETFAEGPPGSWLINRVPWTAAEHRIRAVAADGAAAAALGLAPGAPCLVIERRTWRAEEPVTFVELTYPGAAHELVARFTPSQR